MPGVLRLLLPYALVLAAVLVPWLGGPLAGSPGRIGLLLLGGLGWVLALRWVPRERLSRAGLAFLLGGALLLRIAALLGTPGTSDDVHRYVWEGALVLAGESPYAHAPASEERAAERARWPALYAQVNHPEVSAAYPPLTQAVCALGVLLGGDPARDGGRGAERALRLLFAAADLLVLWPLGVLLARHGRARGWLVAWAWCPLVALEAGGAAHFDVVGILLLVLALAAAEAGRPARAALALAGGALVKWLPLAAAPFVARGARRPLAFAGLLLGAILAGFVPVLLLADGTHGWFGGLGEYAFRWESFNLVFRWIEGPLHGRLKMDESWSDPRRVARALVLLVLLLAALRLWWRRADAVTATGALIALFLVLTPTLHPWYLAWVVPFLALRPSPAFAWLVAAAPLAYWPLGRWQAEGVWVEPAWLWPVLALPFFALLALELVRARRAREGRA